MMWPPALRAQVAAAVEEAADLAVAEVAAAE